MARKKTSKKAARKKASKKATRKKTLGKNASRVRKLCLALPDATEKEAWGTPTFRIKGKRLFAYYMTDHHGDGREAIWCDAEPGAQQMLVESDPERFFVPPYVGVNGWIGIKLNVKDVDWDAVAGLVAESYRLTAAKGR